jgi:hypothetical protein
MLTVLFAVPLLLAHVGGWRALARQYPGANELLDGEHYGMEFVGLDGIQELANVTVSSSALSLVPVLVYRYLHGRITIPWNEVASCEPERAPYGGTQTMVWLRDGPTLKIPAAAGRAVAAVWQESHPGKISG